MFTRKETDGRWSFNRTLRHLYDLVCNTCSNRVCSGGVTFHLVYGIKWLSPRRVKNIEYASGQLFLQAAGKTIRPSLMQYASRKLLSVALLYFVCYYCVIRWHSGSLQSWSGFKRIEFSFPQDTKEDVQVFTYIFQTIVIVCHRQWCYSPNVFVCDLSRYWFSCFFRPLIIYKIHLWSSCN